MYIYIWLHIYLNIFEYIFIHSYTNLHVYINIYKYMHTYIGVYIHIYLCMYIGMYTHIYIYLLPDVAWQSYSSISALCRPTTAPARSNLCNCVARNSSPVYFSKKQPIFGASRIMASYSSFSFVITLPIAYPSVKRV